MKKLAITALIVATAISAIAVPSARAENGQIAAGVAGGLLGGLLLGGALAQRPHYYERGPVYVQPEPVYVEPPRYYDCYWTRGEPYWDDDRGIWRRPRVRVCD
ncbi:MAG: hypothetical protein Q8M24_25075 [Pseudolabrys sp.]|nr:hypothetical protein [Pseudolabrys sp.]MDP2298724.1 hypothetical protein [Pseudolabrys sp.]